MPAIPYPRRHFLSLTVGSVASLIHRPVAAGCAATGGTVRIRKKFDIISLDPAHCPPDDELLARSIFAPLVRAQPKTRAGDRTWAEHSAVSLKWVDDRTIDFRLRPKLLWLGGTSELTTRDVKYSFERILDPKINSRYRYRWDNVAAIEIKDNTSGFIRLRRPDSGFLPSALLHASGCLVSETAVKGRNGIQVGPDGRPSPDVTLGRYFVEGRRGAIILLACNPQWSGPQPYFERAEFHIIENDDVAQLQVQSGRLDLMRAEPDWLNQKPPGEFASLDKARTQSLRTAFLVINPNEKPFTDRRVRLALSLSIDVGRLVEAVYGEYGIVAAGFIPSALPGSRSKPLRSTPNMADAKKFLAESGLLHGFETEIHVAPELSSLRKILEGVASNFAALGVKLRTVFKNPFQAALAKERVTMALLRPELPPDPLVWAELFASQGSFNVTRYSSPEYDDLFEKARTAEPGGRQELLQRMQNLVEQDGAVAPLVEERAVWLHRKGLNVPLTQYGILTDVGDIDGTGRS